MKSSEKVNAFSQIPENDEVSWSFLRETPLNAFLFLHGMVINMYEI